MFDGYFTNIATYWIEKAVATSISDEGERSPENWPYDVMSQLVDIRHISYYAILQLF